jgi:hypothetical protein
MTLFRPEERKGENRRFCIITTSNNELSEGQCITMKLVQLCIGHGLRRHPHPPYNRHLTQPPWFRKKSKFEINIPYINTKNYFLFPHLKYYWSISTVLRSLTVSLLTNYLPHPGNHPDGAHANVRQTSELSQSFTHKPAGPH